MENGALYLKELSKKLGISTSKLAEIMGYTRTGVYSVFENMVVNNRCDTQRMNCALKALERYFVQDLNNKITVPELEYKNRMNSLKEIQEWVEGMEVGVEKED